MNAAKDLDLDATIAATGRDSGLVDLGMLAAAEPLRPVSPLDGLRVKARRGASVGGLAIAVAVLASFASTAMASRALYLVRRGVAVDASAPALRVSAPETDELPPADPPAREADVAHAVERVAAPSTPEALAPAASTKATSAERSSRRRVATAAPAAALEAPVPSPRPATATSSLDELMERVAAPETNAAASAAPSEAMLPDLPSRADVSRALGSLSSRVGACGDEGTAMVRFVFDGPTGSVRDATVTGDLAGSPAARCVEDAVSGVRLPRFGRTPFVVTFPYRL